MEGLESRERMPGNWLGVSGEAHLGKISLTNSVSSPEHLVRDFSFTFGKSFSFIVFFMLHKLVRMLRAGHTFFSLYELCRKYPLLLDALLGPGGAGWTSSNSAPGELLDSRRRQMQTMQ